MAAEVEADTSSNSGHSVDQVTRRVRGKMTCFMRRPEARRRESLADITAHSWCSLAAAAGVLDEEGDDNIPILFYSIIGGNKRAVVDTETIHCINYVVALLLLQSGTIVETAQLGIVRSNNPKSIRAFPLN